MFSIAKRITSAVVAGAVVLGSLTVYPNITQKKEETIVRAAELPPVMDAASSVNYSTILGRGVDYGILAENFQQRDHMQSTFAVINFSKTAYTVDTFSTINLNPIGSTAQVLVNSVVTSGQVFGIDVAGPRYLMLEGNESTNVLNIEGSSQVFNPGYYHFQSFSDQVITVNDNTEGNIRLIMNDAFTASEKITNKVKNGYAINYRDYYDDTTSTSYAILDLTKGDFANKVVYIKVDDNLMKKAGVADGLRIIKDSSTVIVFELDDSVKYNDTRSNPRTGRPIGKSGNDSEEYVVLNKFRVSVDGGNSWIFSDDYSGRYNEDDKAKLNATIKCDQEICQKIIWNITTGKNVALDNTSGLFIVPDAFVETLGTSAGWIVAKNFTNSHGEWHYIYGGGSQNVLYDEQGEIHFAANKTFTHAWDGADTKQDTTIYTAPETYSFYWYENNAEFTITDPQNLTDAQREIIKNTGTNKLQFPTLKFFNNKEKAVAAGLSDHYIPEGPDGVSFYYTIREVGAGTTNSDGIQISEGYIDIVLTVKNDNGKLKYYVYSETYLGDGSYYENNEGTATVGNDAIFHGRKVRQTRMSGIEFFLGECFNLAETSIDLKKTVTGDYTPKAGETFTYYVYNKALNKYFYLDDEGKIASSDEKTGVKVEYGQDKVTRLLGIPVGEYTVSEDYADATRRGYTLTPPADKDVQVNLTSTPVVNIVNDYTSNPDEIGKLVLTKTIKGLVTEEDLEGLVFTVTDEATSMVVWEHKLSDSEFKVSTDAATGDKKYEATIENLNLTKTYKVLETLYTPDGYAFVQVSYKIGSNAEVQGDFDAEGIRPTADGINVDYTNEYSRIAGKLVVVKELKEGTTDISGNDDKEFKFVVSVGKDEGYLQPDGKIGADAYPFTVKPGSEKEIPVDYTVFNKALTVSELTSSLPEIDGYTFVSANVTYTNSRNSVDGQHLDAKATITNNYEKTPVPVGTVVITKTISEADLSDFESIVFTVTRDGLVIEVPVLSTTTVGTEVGTTWVKEAEGKYTYTISGVPLNTKFEVTETSANFLGSAVNKYTVDSDKTVKTGNVTVTSTTSDNEIVLTNAYKVNKGTVVISKSISEAPLSDFEKITFTVKADGVEVSVPDLSTANVNKGLWTDAGNGKYTYTIEDVPVNTVYEVKENIVSFLGNASKKYTLDSSKSELSGSTKVELADKSYEIALTNTYKVNTGNVIISKSITGADLTDFETIHFDVTADGKAVSVPDLTTAAVGTDWIDEGKGVYTYTINNVPVTTEYKVTETLVTPSGTATTTYTLDTNNSKTKGEVTVDAADTDYFIILNNAYVADTGALKVTKTIGVAKLTDFEKITFTITGDKGTTNLTIPDLTTDSVNDGTWTDEGDGKYSYTITGLKVGEKFTVTEKLASFLGTASNKYEVDTAKTKTSDNATIVANDTVNVALTNAYTEKQFGSLKVTKTISTAKLTDFEKITFTITGDKGTTNLTIPDLTTDSVNDGTWTDEGDGKYSYMITGLTPGEKFTVTEKLASFLGTASNKYEVDTAKTKTSDNATIVANDTVNVALTNAYTEKQLGSLKVTKTISVAELKDFEKITFTITGDQGTTNLTIPDLTTDSVNDGTWTDEGDGKYSYTITGLTPGEKFTVTEKLASFLGTASTKYEVDTAKTKTSDNATIVANDTVNVALTNAYTEKQLGSLKVTKTISVAELKDFEKITFSITGDKGTNNITIPDLTLDNVNDGTWTDEGDGKYSYTVNNLPAGEKFTVTEKLASFLGTASTKYEVDTAKTKTSDNATIVANDTVNVALTNAYTEKQLGSLKVTKTISVAELKDFEKITFTITGDQGTTNLTIPDLTTDSVNDGTWTDEGDGKYSYTITGLKVGEKFTVTEKLASFLGTSSNKYEVDTAKTKTSDNATIVANDTVNVALTNAYTEKQVPTGSLKVTKTISVAELKDFEKITFSITGDKGTNNIKIPDLTLDNVNDGTWTDEGDGKYSYTITGLTPGEKFTVTEKLASFLGTASNKYEVDTAKTKTSDNATIVANDTVNVALTNAYTEKQFGSLKVTKTISTAKLTDFEKITFTITGDQGTTNITIPDLTTDSVNDGTWTDEGDGKYSYTITGLTPGEKFTVTEKLASFLGTASTKYEVDTAKTKTSDNATIVANDTVNVALTNAYTEKQVPTGSLKVTKTISVAELKDFEKITFSITGDKGTNNITIPNLTLDNVNDGTWTDEGDGKYSYTITGLTPGEKFTVTEKLASFLGTASTKYEVDTAKTKTSDNATIVANDTVNVALTNAYTEKQLGSLKVTKTISVAELKDFEKITFSITGDKGTNNITIPNLTLDNVNDGTWTDEGDGKYSYTVNDLPAGEKFTVTEKLASFLGTASTKYEVDTAKTKTSDNATIVANDTVNVALTNAYTEKTTPVTTGSLTVSKTISGAPLKDFEKITFSITGDKGTNNITIPNLTLDNVNDGTWTDEGNGKYTYTVSDLPAGEKFTVKETLDSFLGTATTQYEKDTDKSTDKAEATIVAGENVTAALTDTYTVKTTPVTTGSLTVSKTISGAPLKDFEKLTFTIEGDKGTNNITIPNLTLDNVNDGTWTDEGNGKYTYTVSDLPAGEKFTVKETLDSFLGTATTQYEKDTDKSTDKAEATIVAGENVTAALTDTYTAKTTPVLTGSISITKTVVGTDPTSGSFTFTVKCGDDYVQDTTGSVASTYADFTIADGETIDISGLELGKTYVIEENEVTGLPSGIVCATTYSDSDKVVLDLSTTSGAVTITNTFTDNNQNTTDGSITVTKLVTGSVTSAMPDKYYFYIECGDKYVQQDGSLGDSKYLFEVGANSDVTVNNLGTDTKTYKVVEEGVDVSSLPSGYGCDEPSYSTPTITLDDNNKSGSVVITNNFTYTAPNPGPVTGILTITLELTGDIPTGAPSKEYTFTVTGPSFPNGKTITITGEGSTILDDLIPGTYTVVESRPVAEIDKYDLDITGHDNVPINVIAGENSNRTIVNEYTIQRQPQPTKGTLTFTKTFGGDVTEREAAGDNLYFVITNGNGEYLALDGTISSTEVRITLADLDHTDGTRVWTKTINDVPLGTYTVTEHNDEIYIGGSNIPYTMDATSVRTASTTIDNSTGSSLSGYLDLTNIYLNGPDLDVTISKQDIAGKEIAEAELTFTSLDGHDLSNVVVTQNGVQIQITISPDKHAISFITVDTAPSIIKGLRAGRYELKETVTPKSYLTAEAIVFSLLPDGSTECGQKVTVAGSPIVMVDKADPNYKTDKDTEVISANREPKSIPATGETTSVVTTAGIVILTLSAACFTGYFVFNTKKRKTEEE